MPFSIHMLTASVKSIFPTKAVGLKNKEREAHCCTEVITEMLDDNGNLVILSFTPKGKTALQSHVAIYVRVSSEKQRGKTDGQLHRDGFSEDDQLGRCIRYCLQHKLAFRIYSDCGLSGFLPPDIDHLRVTIAEQRAESYETIFTNIFLSEYAANRYSEDEIQSLTAYRDMRVAEYREGALLDGEETEARSLYRPGLTVLLEDLPLIHTVLITDLSRLSRSFPVTLHVVNEIVKKQKCMLVGLIEPIADPKGITLPILAWQAEQYLSTLSANSIRGTLEMLRSGCSPSSTNIPWWLVRDNETGKAKPHPELFEEARRVIDRYLAGEAAYSLYQSLKERDGPAPRQGWTPDNIAALLDAKTVTGQTSYYGLTWNVLPRLINDDTYWRLKQSRQDRSQPGRPRGTGHPEHLMAGLLICVCGAHMNYKKNMGQAVRMGPQYICEMLHARSDGKRHITIQAHWIEEFVNEIITRHPVGLLQAGNKKTSTAVEGELVRHIATRLEEVRKDLRYMESQERQKAIVALEPYKLSQSYNNLVVELIKTATAEIRQIERDLEAQLANERKRQEALAPAALWADVPSQAKHWVGLTVKERNAVLRGLFIRWQFEGAPPYEKLVPYLRGIEEERMEPIMVPTTGKNTFRRSLEDVEGWMDRALGLRIDENILPNGDIILRPAPTVDGIANFRNDTDG
jgi:Resolvase, N terminal domain